MSLPGYDSWLEAPYQRLYAGDVPREAEDLMDVRIWLEEDDCYGVVEGFETWEDADEDGRYGGVDLVVRLESGRAPRTRNMSPTEVEERLSARPEREEEE
jgi:hypothetical protein